MHACIQTPTHTRDEAPFCSLSAAIQKVEANLPHALQQNEMKRNELKCKGLAAGNKGRERGACGRALPGLYLWAKLFKFA